MIGCYLKGICFSLETNVIREVILIFKQYFSISENCELLKKLVLLFDRCRNKG